MEVMLKVPPTQVFVVFTEEIVTVGCEKVKSCVQLAVLPERSEIR